MPLDLLEKQEKKLDQEEYNAYPGIKTSMLADVTTKELEEYRELLEKEIQARERAARLPKRRRV